VLRCVRRPETASLTWSLVECRRGWERRFSTTWLNRQRSSRGTWYILLMSTVVTNETYLYWTSVGIFTPPRCSHWCTRVSQLPVLNRPRGSWVRRRFDTAPVLLLERRAEGLGWCGKPTHTGWVEHRLLLIYVRGGRVLRCGGCVWRAIGRSTDRIRPRVLLLGLSLLHPPSQQ